MQEWELACTHFFIIVIFKFDIDNAILKYLQHQKYNLKKCYGLNEMVTPK